MKKLIMFSFLVWLCIGCRTTGSFHKEVGVFYIETEGEFVMPITVDAPVMFSWTSTNGTIKGTWHEIFKEFDIYHNDLATYSDVEVVLLNYLVSQGWRIAEFQIASESVSSENFRTAYKYILIRD